MFATDFDKMFKILKIDKNYCQRNLNWHMLDKKPEEDDKLCYDDKEPDYRNYVPKINKLDKERKKEAINSMKIEPLVKEEDCYITINDILPKLPFLMLLCGFAGSGKSTTLSNILKWIYNYFDNIFIFSATADKDATWLNLIKMLEIPKENIFLSYEEGLLKDIIKAVNKECKNKEPKDKPHTLIIIDDLIEYIPKESRGTVLNKLYLNRRHYNISVIMTSQTYKGFGVKARKNASQFILYKTDNIFEKESIQNELCGSLGTNKKDCLRIFQSIFDEATRQPKSFLYINNHQSGAYHLMKNFDEPIDISKYSNNQKQIKGTKTQKEESEDDFDENDILEEDEY